MLFRCVRTSLLRMAVWYYFKNKAKINVSDGIFFQEILIFWCVSIKTPKFEAFFGVLPPPNQQELHYQAVLAFTPADSHARDGRRGDSEKAKQQNPEVPTHTQTVGKKLDWILSRETLHFTANLVLFQTNLCCLFGVFPDFVLFQTDFVLFFCCCNMLHLHPWLIRWIFNFCIVQLCEKFGTRSQIIQDSHLLPDQLLEIMVYNVFRMSWSISVAHGRRIAFSTMQNSSFSVVDFT